MKKIALLLLILISHLLYLKVFAQNLNFGGGVTHSVYKCGDGRVFIWGADNTGQFGDGAAGGASVTSTQPQCIGGGACTLDNISQVDGGSGQFNVALDYSGNVIAWGENNRGQLGRGACCVNSRIPNYVLNSGGTVFGDVKFVTATNETAYAVKNDGTVWAWGSNDNGQIGDGTSTDRYNPVQISFPAGVSIVSIDGGDDYVLALDANGCVWSWGLNDRGQLGYGNNTASSTRTPQQVKLSAAAGDFLCGVTSIAAGDATAYAVKADGTVFSWGKNTNGQIGSGSAGGNGGCSCQWYPQQVACGSVGGANCSGGYLTGVTQISGGQSHVIALLNTGEVVGWGAGADGALGNGSTANQLSPTYVQTSAGVRLTGIDAISDGDLNGWAYDRETNYMYVWGDNASGQLGPGSVMGTDRLFASGGFFLAASCNIALPVQLSFFKAVIINDIVQLSWATDKEENCMDFQLQKLINGTWITIKIVPCSSNSAFLKTYQEYDSNPIRENYYRLVQRDNSGEIHISQIIHVSLRPIDKFIFYPNPVSRFENLAIEGWNQPGNIKLINSEGVIVFNQYIEDNINSINLTGLELSTGCYFLIIDTDSYSLRKKLVVY